MARGSTLPYAHEQPRALDADDGGPQADHADANATTDAISRRTVLDD